jgi:hypothetical protein
MLFLDRKLKEKEAMHKMKTKKKSCIIIEKKKKTVAHKNYVILSFNPFWMAINIII